MAVVERGSGAQQHQEWYSAMMRYQDRLNAADTIYDWTIKVPDTLPIGRVVELDVKNIYVVGETQEITGTTPGPNEGEWRLDVGGRSLGWSTENESGITIGYTRKMYDSLISTGVIDHYQVSTEVIDHPEIFNSFSNIWRVRLTQVEATVDPINDTLIEDIHIHIIYRVVK